METSDDPVTILLVGGAVAGGMMMGKKTAGGGFEMPVVESGQPKKTATSLEQVSEKAKLTRRKAASLITKDWDAPSLGAPGLLGLGA